jgi:hypothetical protein
MAYLFDRRTNRHSVDPNICGLPSSKKPLESSSKIHRGTAPIAQLFAFRLPQQTLRPVPSSIADFPGFRASADQIELLRPASAISPVYPL